MLLPLFLVGISVGGVSVFLHFFFALIAGEYPVRIVRIPIRKKKKGNARRKKKRRGCVRKAFLDFFFTFLTGAYLVLYDVTVLGGRGRIHHLAFFFFGVFFARFLLLRLFFGLTENVFRFFFDLIRVAALALTYPFRILLSLFFSILFRAYLILKRKNDRMKMKRKAKREIARLCREADTAFLCVGATETLASGRN